MVITLREITRRSTLMAGYTRAVYGWLLNCLAKQSLAKKGRARMAVKAGEDGKEVGGSAHVRMMFPLSVNSGGSLAV